MAVEFTRPVADTLMHNSPTHQSAVVYSMRLFPSKGLRCYALISSFDGLMLDEIRFLDWVFP